MTLLSKYTRLDEERRRKAMRIAHSRQSIKSWRERKRENAVKGIALQLVLLLWHALPFAPSSPPPHTRTIIHDGERGKWGGGSGAKPADGLCTPDVYFSAKFIDNYFWLSLLSIIIVENAKRRRRGGIYHRTRAIVFFFFLPVVD